MASANNTNKGINNNQQNSIRCMQINLQHSRLATDNLMNLIQQDYIDTVFVQEPHLIQNKTAGITRIHRTCISDDVKSWAAIITADSIDAVLIKQLCNRENVVLELRYKNTRTLAANMYLDISEETDERTAKVGEILNYNNGSGIIIAMDSNSRSTGRYDNKTKQEVKRWKNI